VGAFRIAHALTSDPARYGRGGHGPAVILPALSMPVEPILTVRR
jgi:hypothetical protein